MQRAIFLDRDGTIIDNLGDLGDPAEVTLIPGAAGGMRKLVEAGWVLVVVTNQGGVARGAFTEDDIATVHVRIDELLGEGLVSRYYHCPFHPEGSVDTFCREHPDRKPSPGMLQRAATDFSLDLAASWMIGDTSRDILAGQGAGCRTIWLTDGGRVDNDALPTAYAPDLAAAADLVLAFAEQESGSH